MKRIIPTLLTLLLSSCGDVEIPKSELALKYARQRVLEKLKSPSQTDFLETKIVAGRPDTAYIVSVLVDAPNSFGVKLRKSYLVALKMHGDTLTWNPTYVVQEASAPPTDAEIKGMVRLNGIN